MEKETKLILRSLKWIIENKMSEDEMQYNTKCNIVQEIGAILNPPKQIPLEDKTKDALLGLTEGDKE